MNEKWRELHEILKKEVVPALGCTGPTAVSYVAAEAATAVGGTPIKVEVKVDRHIGTKNSDVGIPGTTVVGLKMAAASWRTGRRCGCRAGSSSQCNT